MRPEKEAQYRKDRAKTQKAWERYYEHSNDMQRQRERDTRDNIEKMKSNGGSSRSSCWIATAYYGHPHHPEVEIMRAYRNNLLQKKVIGTSIKHINNIYHRIGESSFGQNWASNISSKENSFKKIVSAFALKIFKAIIKLTSKL